MACYIASNDNRFYVAQEAAYGSVPEPTAENRISAVSLRATQSVEKKTRRDKIGGRTYVGLPAGLRKQTSFDLKTYMAAWSEQDTPPPCSPLFESAMGAAPLLHGGAVIQAVETPTRLRFSGAHNLQVGQAVAAGGELRFVTAVVSAAVLDINAPFGSGVAAGTSTTPTATYSLGKRIPSLSVYDFWTPEAAVQRVICGAAVNEMKVRVNSDFHEFRFAGPARDILDNLTFAEGQGDLSEFPIEPEVTGVSSSVIPGNMGQVWLGTNASRFYTLTEAEVALENGIETRSREFGLEGLRCLAAGERRVSVNFELYASDEEQTTGLYEAARQRSPLRVMMQLGQQPGQLFGMYMKSVVAELPDFDDSETRLRWRFEDCRAQGTSDDELVVAFA